jgi:tRNA U34 5-methylaminomethyl-2-thiouridine-forming methyltransferase MnmC
VSTAWIPVRTEDGSSTLRHPLHGEACHSLAGARQQARERYAEPCRLRARAQAGEAVLRLLDVGTGLGLNLAAAFEALEGTPARLEVVTLEIDRSVFAAARALLDEPGAIADRSSELRAEILDLLVRAADEPAAGLDLGARGRIELLLGDARREIVHLRREPRFDAVFLDPFSPGREPELWTEAFLREVAARMASGSRLSTYSSTFRVRRALALAGLQVGLGPRVGRKAEGTLASPDGGLPPLPARVASRLERSLRDADGSGTPSSPSGPPCGRPMGDREGALD